ncbi:nitrate ABC transporter permease [Acidovorax sp. A79]|uniref:nitrate ABC transporter permease n=1 Tax=Acidovorax sp. A79 TaxID=3056107 RepID=UPI0034E8EDE8
MVSAVFHSPLDAAPVVAQNAMNNVASSASSASARSQKQSKTAMAASPAPTASAAPAGRDWAALSRGFWMAVLPPLCGLGLLVGLWAVVSATTGNSIPGPVETWKQALEIFSNPFYRNGPNDQGVGWNVLMSLERVAVGFGMAALVGIPAGFVIGRFNFLSRMFNPLISLLRPVSPLAWLPIGLLVFKGANPAAIWTIFICSIWPMIINTAVGVQRVPQDYMNVARVLNLSEWKIATKILFPAVLPYMLTGVRLAVGTAWLVIVAAEMLTGGVGIGFWVWDEWNNLNVKNIIIAIFVIGIVGLVLEFALIKLATAFTFEEVKT